MPFKFNPPTRTQCDVCEQLAAADQNDPIIDTHNGKSSSANNFDFHNWYNFVLGYSPQFPKFMLERENITSNDLVVDPFMGAGTTLVACKDMQIPSGGTDANDFMVFAATTKLNWNLDLESVKARCEAILACAKTKIDEYEWVTPSEATPDQLKLFSTDTVRKKSYVSLVKDRREKMLLEKYISDKPFAKLTILNDVIHSLLQEGDILNLFTLAVSSIIVPISNVRYGPGFGVGKPKDDVDVLKIFTAKINKMISDLGSLSDEQRNTPSSTYLGDARQLSSYFEPSSVKLMVTSPPYPGDHEYTKHTRLELIFRGLATNQDEFRVIKKRMLRGSTTNLYHDDNDREPIKDCASIKLVTDTIQERLTHDGATSGFEKLYTKLVWEYFGGMYKTLAECLRVLQPGGKIALLVSDSHAFKMVHIETAQILMEIGILAGFEGGEILIWQLKPSTSHKYYLRENVLILTKSLEPPLDV